MSSQNPFLRLACSFAVLFAPAVNANAGTIATWTFETSQPMTAGPISPEVGSGTASAFHASPLTFSTPSGNGSTFSYSANSWTVGDYFQFLVSTTGQSGILFSWDQTRSSSGPGFQDLVNPNFKLEYSTDGSNFTLATNYLVPVVTWNNTTSDASTKYFQNLSAITALDNQATVYFRLTSILPDQASSTAGTSRVDNVSVATIPEPAGLVLLLVGLLGVAIVRRCV